MDGTLEVELQLLPVHWESPSKRFRIYKTGEKSFLAASELEQGKGWKRLSPSDSHVMNFLITELYLIAGL